MGSTRLVTLKFNYSPMLNIKDAKGQTLYVRVDGTSFWGKEESLTESPPIKTKIAEPAKSPKPEPEPEIDFKTYIDMLISKNPKGTLFYKETKKLIKQQIKEGKERGETYDPYVKKSCSIM